MIFILDKQEKVINILKNSGGASDCSPFFDDVFTEDLATGSETFQFTTIANNKLSKDLVVGNYIAFKKNNKYKLFQIMQTEETHDETLYITVYCEGAGLELINKIFRKRTMISTTLKKFLQTILEETGWNVGLVSSSALDSLDLEIDDGSVYSILQEVLPKYGVEMEFRVEINNGRISKKYIDTYKTRGKVTGKRFTFGRDIEGLTRKTDSTELFTALIGKGKNDTNFKDITVDGIDKPLGQDFVADQESFEKYNHNGYHIMGVYEFDTESPEELLRETYKKLQEVKEVKVEYEIPVAMLEEVLGNSLERLSIGDTVSIYDNAFNPPIQLMARVSKLETSFTNPDSNVCTLANFVEVASNITAEMRKIASKLEGYVDEQFPIGGDKIQNGAVSKDQLDNKYIETIKTDVLESGRVITTELIAEEAKITNAKIENLKANTAEIDNAIIKDAQITNAKVENLEADVAQIDTLLAGNITADNIMAGSITANEIASGTITAGSGIIADGAIGSAQISSIDAGKISAGKIDTSKVEVSGVDGHLKLKGNRLQVFQGIGNQAKERVSIGDVNNDGTVYGLRVRGVDGQTILLDENGVKREGITDGSITNEKISGDANIDGAKLNINSVVNKINEDGTEVIKGTKIEVDGTNLTAKLSKITDKQTQDSERITQSQAKIEANESAIKLKVDNQTYESDKKDNISKFNKLTSDVEILQGEISLKVEENDIQQAINDIQIGGRNLLKNSNFANNLNHWKAGDESSVVSDDTYGKVVKIVSTASSKGINQVATTKLELQKQYTLSCYVKANTSTKVALALNGNGISEAVLKEVGTDWTRISEVFTNNGNNAVPRIYSGENKSVEFYIAQVLFQEGNKLSSWTPAPEDFSSEVDTKISSAKSEIKVTTDAITQRVQTAETTLSQKANTSDVYGKGDVYTKSEVYTKNETNSQINVAKNDITLSVSNTYETKSNVENKITNATNTLTNKIDEIQIGATNLLTKKINFVYGYISASDGIVNNSGTLNSNQDFYNTNYIALKSGENLIFKSHVKESITSKIQAAVYVHIYNTSKVWQKCVYHVGNVNNAATVSYKAAEDCYVRLCSRGFNDYNHMAEKGTKPSDYSPSPQDIDSVISNKANSSDVYKKSETYTKSETDSKISVAQNDITLSVSNTYETKSNVESKVNNAINNIQVGATNMATSTNQGTTGWGWGLQTGGKTISEVTENGIRCCKMVRDNVASTGWSYIEYTKIGRDKYLPNKKYTISFEVKSSVVTSFYVGLKQGNSTNSILKSETKTGNTVANVWTKLTATVTTLDTLPSSTSQVLYLNSMNSDTGVSYIFRNLIITEGNKAATWSPAPEDVTASINSKANSSDVYTKSEVYTKSQTDSAINVAKNDITLSVSNTYETKSNVESKVNNAVTSLKVGGDNVLRNGNFVNGMNNWSAHDMNSGGSSKSVVVKSGDGVWSPSDKMVLIIQGTNTTDRYGVMSSAMKLVPNTKYTISGYCSGHRVNKIQVNVRDKQSDNANIHTISIAPVSGGSTLDKWYRFETTFTTTSNTDFALNLYSVSFADNGYVWFCDVQIQQGTKATAWTPCLQDINSSIDAKANSSDVYKKSETYTKSETDSKISVAQNDITLSVSNTYETKSNVESKITNAVNNIQVGGRNLAIGTSDSYKSASGFTGTTNYCVLSHTINTKTLSVGDKVTVSFMFKCENLTNNNTARVIRIQGSGDVTGWNSGAFHSYNIPLDYSKPNQELKVSYTFTVIADHLKNSKWHINFRTDYITGGTIYVKELLAEKGTRASSWTPAPEDIDSAIGSKANSSDVYKKSETYTKSETDSKIQVAKDSITSTVSSNYVTKGDASNIYATKSSLTQTTDKIVADFKSTGGYNLLKNSDAKNGTNFWQNNGGGLSVSTAGGNPFIGDKEFKTSFPHGIKYSEDLRLKSNTDYVYEAWIYTNTAITSNSVTPLHFWCSSQAGVSGQSQCTIIDYRQNLTTNAYTKVYVHFRTKSGDVFFRPFIYSSVTSGVVCAKQISLSEGTTESPWTPHPNEVYSGSTVIDANGVTINNGALTVKNKSGATVLNGDSNGNLVFSGTAKSQSGARWVGLDFGGLTFQDSQKSEQLLRIGNSYFSSNRDMNGVNFAMPQYSDFLRFSHIAKTDLTDGWTSSDSQYLFFDCWSSDQADGSVQYKKGINVFAPMYVNNGGILFKNNSSHTSDIKGKITWNTITDLLGIFGDNGLSLGYKNGNSYQARIVMTEGSHPSTNDQIRSWGNWNLSEATIHNGHFNGKSLTISGSKNCIQKTKNYGGRLINAYETAEYYFGDLGFGKINKDGECLVYIDDIFLECINTNVQYHVFTQCYNGEIESIERYNTHFIIKGKPDTEFSWELKAKRIGYENNRLDVEDLETSQESGFEMFSDEELKAETSEDILTKSIIFNLEELLMEEI